MKHRILMKRYYISIQTDTKVFIRLSQYNLTIILFFYESLSRQSMTHRLHVPLSVHDRESGKWRSPEAKTDSVNTYAPAAFETVQSIAQLMAISVSSIRNSCHSAFTPGAWPEIRTEDSIWCRAKRHIDTLGHGDHVTRPKLRNLSFCSLLNPRCLWWM